MPADEKWWVLVAGFIGAVFLFLVIGVFVFATAFGYKVTFMRAAEIALISVGPCIAAASSPNEAMLPGG